MAAVPDAPALSVPIDGSINPLAGFTAYAGSLDAKTIASVILALMFAFWALYTLVATYHLLRYGHRSWLTVPAIGIHLFVSFSLAVYAVSGLAR